MATKITRALILLRNEGIPWMDHVKPSDQMSKQPEIGFGENFMNAICRTSSGLQSVRKSGLPPAQIHQMLRQKSIGSFVKEVLKCGRSGSVLGDQPWVSHGVRAGKTPPASRCLMVSHLVKRDTAGGGVLDTVQQ